MELSPNLQVALSIALRGQTLALLSETAAALSASYRAGHSFGSRPVARSAHISARPAFIVQPAPCRMETGVTLPNASRPSFQRNIKGATLGYEDEKFSYLAATRLTPTSVAACILRHPHVRSGAIELMLCTQEGKVTAQTITKREKTLWRTACNAEWGGEW
jgi:hypothetical protein